LKTRSSSMREEALVESLKEMQKNNKPRNKSLQLQKEKEAYETRRAKEAEQKTVPQDRGRLREEALVESLKEMQKNNKPQNKSLQLQKEKEAYDMRRAKEANQGTVPQDRGRLALKTRSSSMPLRNQGILPQDTLQLQKEKGAYEARRAKEAEQGTVPQDRGRLALKTRSLSMPLRYQGTVPQDRGHLASKTRSSSMREKALQEFRQQKHSEGEALAVQKAAWQRRRDRQGGKTHADDIGVLRRDTTAASRREEALQEFRQQKRAEEDVLAVQKAAWQRRQDRQGGKTHTDDIGALGRDTAAVSRRKSAREADEADRVAKALQEKEEKKAQDELWQRRMSNRSKSHVGSNTGLAFQMKNGSLKRSNTSQSSSGWGGGASREIGLVRSLSGISLDSFEGSMDSDDTMSLACEAVTSPPTNLDLEGIPEDGSESGSSGAVQLGPGAEMV
jgi:hypothetical protein